MVIHAAHASIKLLVVHVVLPGLLLMASLLELDSSTPQQQDKQQSTPARRAKRPNFEKQGMAVDLLRQCV